MSETLFWEVTKKDIARRRKSRWNKFVRVLAAVVVFCTVYALVLPAVTMGDEAICGMEEHTHTDACWRSQSVTAVCPAAQQVVLHSHDEGCYDEYGILWCPLPERAAHLHTDGCMEDREVLVCLIDEVEPHTHGEGCYVEESAISCGLEETAPHSHGEGCFVEETVLNCTEEHDHDAQLCYTVQQTLVCETAETEGHTHGEGCYAPTQRLNCGLEETLGHSHDGSCYETRRFTVCGLEQVAEHTHDESCCDENGITVCGITAATVHVHDENCSAVTQLAEKELVCTLTEHIHTESCYPVQEAMPTESPYLCGLGEHIHGDACADENGEIICTLTEHIHTAPCVVKDYDSSADVETQTDWEKSVAGVTLTGNLPKDVLAIAESQLGYRESSRNVWLCEDGSLKGYTRYGGWYGVPYGDWCAMFVSFCLKYANAVDVPMDSVCNYYIDKLVEAGMYRDAAGYEPKPGDIIFFDWERTGGAVTDVDHTGIVAEVIRDENGNVVEIKTIEGNREDCVRKMTYTYGDPAIIGYGDVPMGDGKTLICETEAHAHGEGCYDGENLICETHEHTHADECYGYRLFFRGESMEAELLILGMEEIPGDLSLSVLPVTAEQDPETYGAMSAAVELEMEESPYFAGDLGIYQVWILSNGEEFILPDGAKATVDVRFNAPIFSAEDVANGSGMETFLLTAGEPVTLFNGETLDTYEAEMTVGESYANAAAGLTGIRLEIGNQRAFAVVLADTTLNGTFWTRVTSKDQLTSSGTYMIVSAEGNFALRGSTTNSSNYTAVILETIKGNTDYYTIKARSGSVDNNLYWTITPSGSYFTARNQGSSNYIAPSAAATSWGTDTVVARRSSNLTFAYQSAGNIWRISRSGDYLNNTGGAFGATDEKDANQWYDVYYTRSMMIFKLSDVTELKVPEDVTSSTGGSGNGEAPKKPDYDPFIDPSDKKTGDTAVTDPNTGLTVDGKYYSDKATSNIEKKFDLDDYKLNQENDGKILTDKSVIYGDDDYDAFESYAPNTFGITLSALGQEYEMPHEDLVRTPIDVVFVLDVSGSMTTNTAEGGAEGSNASRASAMVEATNKAIKEIMDDHEANRVGIVLYATGAWQLLPLDRYVANNDLYLQIDEQTVRAQNSTTGTRTIHFVETTDSLKTQSGTAYGNIGTGFNQGYGTYTQAGIALGGKTFADIGGDVTYTVSFGEGEEEREYTVNRQPVIILLSDGEPTHATNIYMDPISGPHYGDGQGLTTNAKGIMGYNVILTANYFKRMVGIQYQKPAMFYTVGMGISETDDKPLHGGSTGDTYKRAVLNPTPQIINSLNDSMVGGNVIGTQLKNLIQSKFNGNSVTVTPNWPDPWTGDPHTILPVLQGNPYADNYSYADGAYFGDLSGEALTEIFSKILHDSLRATPYGFILHKSSSIRISDIIGTDMEIKGVPILRYQGVNSDPVEIIDDGYAARYVYKGTYTHPYLPDRVYDLEDIVVKITEDDAFHQVVTMYIPDSALPAYSPELIGKEFYYEALPVRLIYQVGLTDYAQQQVMNLYKTGGTLTYYTNRWEEGIQQANSNLYPSLDNPFYYEVLENGKTRYEPHTDMKDEAGHVTDTIKYQINCAKGQEYMDGEVITKVIHMHGNNGKLVFEVPEVDIPVEKQWSGGVEVPEGTTVDVDIYNVQVTATGKEEATLIKTVTLSAENGWKALFTDMPILPTGYYAVAERVPDGFQAQYSGETKTLVIDNKTVLVAVVDLSDPENIPTVVVTNILKVVLPATGGMGTTVYYTLGMLLVAAALVYIVGVGRLRRKEGS